METVLSDREWLAAAGFVVVSFDSWQRGSRVSEAAATLLPRAWANWSLVAWPLLDARHADIDRRQMTSRLACG